MDRQAELEALKRLNLSEIASHFGYLLDRQKSTRHSVFMKSGTDKIIISRSGPHYIYCSVHDPVSQGTVIDFAQRVIEPGCSLGRVRQLLRPFLNGSTLENGRHTNAGRYAAEIRPSETDLAAVAARYTEFLPIDEPHPYLNNVRGIPWELLQSPRLHNCLRHCPKRGSVIFPHWGFSSSKEANLVGYEIKGPGVNRFSQGGRKGLFLSNGKPGDWQLAIAESGLDALSYLALRGEAGLRVASTSGRMNPEQPALIRTAIEHLGEGSQIIAAFDNDEAGDDLTLQLANLVRTLGRKDLEFIEDRPFTRGADWNQVLMEEAVRAGRIQGIDALWGR